MNTLTPEAIEMLADDYERGMIGPRRLRQYFDYLIQQLAAANSELKALRSENELLRHKTAGNDATMLRAELAAANARVKSEWVKCDDQLPDNCCSCFIWHISKEFGPSCISAHYNSIKKTFGHEERFGGKTTHWMPIPEPPID